MSNHQSIESFIIEEAATMDTPSPQEPASEYFGHLTFSGDVMMRRLPPEIAMSLEATIQKGATLDPAMANTVAAAMKDWAIEHGATHFCHWFHPLTGHTAEKHDAFLSVNGEGVALEKFSGN
ncbi:MAG: glutamine synthetase III, partial [Planctomycetota bacterium]|nr:glutamine synthetase III [Planctomycetota bacterium]